MYVAQVIVTADMGCPKYLFPVIGLYGQLGNGLNLKRTTPQFMDTLQDETIYLIACGAFETVS